MKVVTLLGSPRKDGNTARVLGWVEDELLRLGHGMERVDVVDYIVRGCTECLECQSNKTAPGCSVDDDAPWIFGRLMAADAFILATPLFCWGFSAQLKALIDRSMCMVKGYGKDVPHLLGGKRCALLATAAAGLEDNLDLILRPFELWAEYQGCDAIGRLLVPHCTTPDEISNTVKAKAHELARSVVA